LKFYKKQLNKFYTTEDPISPTKEDLINKLNFATKIQDFEDIIKDVQTDIEEAKGLNGTEEENIALVKARLVAVANVLKQ